MIRRRIRRGLAGGRTLRADVRIPDGPPPRSAVVVVHGFRGSKDRGLVPALAEALVGDGHTTLALSFSGAGLADDPDRFVDLEAFATNTVSREVEELGGVLEAVREGDLLPRPPRRVGVVGHARGGADAVLAAGRGAPVEALVTWAAAATLDRWNGDTRRAWREEGRIHVPDLRTGVHLPLALDLLEDVERNGADLDVRAAASRIGVPWLLVHGEEDRVVPLEEARGLAAAAPRSRLHPVAGAGHDFGTGDPFRPTAFWEEALRATRDHLRRHLGEGDA